MLCGHQEISYALLLQEVDVGERASVPSRAAAHKNLWADARPHLHTLEHYQFFVLFLQPLLISLPKSPVFGLNGQNYIK